MRGRCYNCRTEQEQFSGEPRVLLHALPHLNSPMEVSVPFMCANCGREVGSNVRFVPTNKRVSPSELGHGQSTGEQQFGRIWGYHGTASTLLNYPGVQTSGPDVMFPAHEGRLSTGHAIGRHGDPDLMAEFSAEYLKQFWAIFPRGRLPKTVSEMMPALHLLVNAAELALKAELIRSGRPSGGHSLPTLYGRLKRVHRGEIERRFADSHLSADIRTLGTVAPTVEGVLRVYGESFGGSSVYEDTRYLAEPTTKLKSKLLKGGNLVKDTPYPIFLPVVVQTMIDVYVHFSGVERLKRLGAEVGYRSRDHGNDQHGDWGIVPSSVGLVAIRLAQFAAQDERGELREDFRKFKEVRPPGYCTSWMYGGNTLLFYRAGEAHPEDGETVIDGIECKVWYEGKLGIHPRDLYRLADALETSGEFDEFQWPTVPAS